MALPARFANRFRSSRTRLPGLARPIPPGRRSRLTGRAGRFVVQMRRGRPVRGGFFKSLAKTVGSVVRTVTKLPVIGTVAKTAFSSLPVVGQVVTAVGAVKRLTAASATAGIAGGVAARGTGITGAEELRRAGWTPGSSREARYMRPRRRRGGTAGSTKRRKRATGRRTKRTSRKKGTAKQRAARARFARAAKRGPIRKGTRLR